MQHKVLHQQESILAAKSEKQAIVDMVSEGIELELDALDELIKKYEDALDSQKDLYDYQKKLKKQTDEISSLEKQMSAYSGDTSEETRAKIQQIKVSLETAKENLEETQYDKYVSDQKKLMDELYSEYETVLNMRLDNIDTLISDMIIDVNENASVINSTITEASESVGYTLSEEMQNIWDASGGITEVLTTYTNDVKDGTNAITTLNQTIASLDLHIQDMMDKLDDDAEDKSKNVPNAAKSNDSALTRGKITKIADTPDDKDNNNIFDYKKDSYDKSKLNVEVSIIDRLKYHNFDSSFEARTKYYKKMGLSGTYTGSASQNKKMISWMREHGYKNGVYRLSQDELAWTQEGNELEAIIRPSDGAILTPLAKNDSVLNSTATSNLFEFTNDPSSFIRDNLNIGNSVESIPQQNNMNNTYDNDFSIQIELPNVMNYEQFKYAMQHDKNFEKMVRAMTVDKMFGGSSLKKYKC